MHNIPDFLKISSEMQEHFAKGGLIKRADGSYSRRGLWDNIRANRGSGKEPTKEMLEQEAKIRAQEQYGGRVEEYGNGGYTVKRSSARKGKTHVVIGPDGTKKYFGDSKLGQHPNDPARKKAFYARHKHNLEHNPYFRAFARATWEDGGEVPHFDNGGNYGAFYGRRDATKMQNMFTPSADSMTPSFAVGGLTKYQTKGFVDDVEGNSYMPQTGNSGQGINTTTVPTAPAVAATAPVQPTQSSTIMDDKNQLSAGLKQNASSFNGQPFGMMAPDSSQAPSPLTNESLTNYLQSNTPEASASRQNTEDYNYQQSMQKDFGKSMDEVDMAYKDVAAAHPNYTNQEVLKTVRTNYQDELNKKNADLKNQAEKEDLARRKSIAKTMEGASQAIDSTFAGLDILSRMNGNSSQMAVLRKNRENANPTNTMNIVGNRKGIEYAAYGGYAGLKEGVELNLSTQQIHELEKQGYKFQIL